MTYDMKLVNIKCTGCTHTIKTGLGKLPGVESVEVDIPKGVMIGRVTS